MRIDINNPPHKYSLIYADPPWKYNDTRGSDPGWFGITYDVMDTSAIAALPIQQLVEKDCALLLWVTSPFLPDGIRVMEAWGFKYKTVAFCWSKLTKYGKRVSNMGQWTMGNIEICLLGIKGHPKRIVKNVKQFVEAERTGHSRKPAEVRNRIEILFGDVSRIELFAREAPKGWDIWGNQAPGKIMEEKCVSIAKR